MRSANLSRFARRDRTERVPISRNFAVIGLGLALLTAIAVWLILYGPTPYPRPAIGGALPHAASTLPPPPRPLETGFMPVSRVEAQTINDGVAFSTEPLEPARPFLLRTAAGAEGLAQRERALDCLAQAVYYEAASESLQGQRAVAQVVLNRMRHPAFPKSICGVVYQGSERTTGCQFTFTCDGSLARQPSRGGWQLARRVALMALAGMVEPSVGTSTHYHANWVVPYWASSLDKVAVVGAHIFYRWKGYWGERSAFTGTYAGEALDTPPPGMAYQPSQELTDTVADGAAAVPQDNRTHLLADEGSSAFAPRGGAGAGVQPAAPAISADQGRGMLMADQSRGTLDDTRLKGGVLARP